MKREHLIALLRVAGYHDDAAAYTRLLVENRISYGKAKAAYAEGVKARENGVPCTCQTCKSERARASARQSAMSSNFGHPPGDRTAALRDALKARPGYTMQTISESGAEIASMTRIKDRLLDEDGRSLVSGRTPYPAPRGEMFTRTGTARLDREPTSYAQRVACERLDDELEDILG